MAGQGRAPKPATMRQGKAPVVVRFAAGSDRPQEVPPLPVRERSWHPLTVACWQRAWESPMAAEWLPSDVDGLGRLAVLWDQFNCEPTTQLLGEIRQQESRYGLSPLDRSRLQWEIRRAEEPAAQVATVRTGTDPRAALMAVRKK